MKRFLYTGEQAHNSTILVQQEGRNVQQDLMLAPGHECELPESHPIVKDLISAGLLTEIVNGELNVSQKKLK